MQIPQATTSVSAKKWTFELVITVPQGTADLTLTDVMPAGLAAQSATFVAINNDSGMTSDIAVGASQAGAGTSGGITIAAAGDSVTFDFGTVTVPGEDDAAATDTEIVVRVTALVEDIGAVTDGVTLQNTATLEIVDPASPGTELQPDVTASETVDVVETRYCHRQIFACWCKPRRHGALHDHAYQQWHWPCI